jgi:SOS response regulatory protein OraA/RecX
MQTHEHYGPNKCLFELMKKGIKKNDIQDVLNTIDFDEKLHQMSFQALCSKKNHKLSHQKKLQKCYLYASSQLGYEQSKIQATLSNIEQSTNR